ncbi:fructose PTS transporter subunit IIA [Enterococcus sp. BWT-B8]|uniref:PTS sugar transporter subunit IIA n=1 Tax=unclassified Enterococcus TaxID=2608891 RepID=UPI001E40D662|nr:MULTISPECIES: fructose PTS transporter subunit IIA [unclassified Enterococcus]MCB5952410.1 fructose PTS transporter subunit IIA [Enterococcus sp. BWT-B8]MCB5955364.1 fructose PTS transporter subunit IIA [Enterococcus sp. CWB-B31]
MTVDIKDILDRKLINLELKATNKNEVIEALAKMLSEKGTISDLETFIKDVYLREGEGITGLGNNVAIPHGKSEGVRIPSVAIGRTENYIDWESYDDKPVRLFFLFAVPDGNEGAEDHLRLLSQVAAKLADDDILTRLKEIRNEDTFINILLSS